MREKKRQEQVLPARTGNTPKTEGASRYLSINLMTLNLMSSIIRYCNDSKRVGEMVKPQMYQHQQFEKTGVEFILAGKI